MWWRCGLILITFVSGSFTGCSGSGQPSTRELEERLQVIQAELDSLARLNLRGGMGAIGYRSYFFKNPNPENQLWLEVNLEQECIIDQVVLVPALWRDSEGNVRPDAMPLAFQIRAGTDEGRVGKVVAEVQPDGNQVENIAPVLISIPETRASWVRIEVSRLSARSVDGYYALQLSEMLIFSGAKNVALRKPVDSSVKVQPAASGAWSERFLVDGVLPYLMDSNQGLPSQAYVSPRGVQPDIYFDLGSEQSITEIHLHTVEQNDTVPQAFPGDLGIPRHVRIEGARQPDFSDAVVLLDFQWENIYDTGPVMMWNIPAFPARFLRAVTLQPSRSYGAGEDLSRMGFAEVVFIAGDRNVSLNQRVWTEQSGKYGGRNPATLVDGCNAFGRILSLREWVSQLARRAELEREQASRTRQLNQRYLRQEKALLWMKWLVIVLGVTITLLIFYGRVLRIRNEANVRKRIAANLHDELGANLHAIGLLGDVAEESVQNSDRLIETVRRIRGLTERTGAAARRCTNMLEAEGFCDDLVAEIKVDTQRILADIRVDLVVENESELNALPRRLRIDLFLFYKECLTNIIRHAHATEVSIRIMKEHQKIVLKVSDDGCGYAGEVPKSLRRRARLMRGSVTVEHPKSGGTLICLETPVRKWWYLV